MFSVLEWKQLNTEIHLKVAKKKVKETKTSYTVITVTVMRKDVVTSQTEDYYEVKTNQQSDVGLADFFT